MFNDNDGDDDDDDDDIDDNDDNDDNDSNNTVNDRDKAEGPMQGHPRLATNVEGWPMPLIVKKGASKGVALDP